MTQPSNATPMRTIGIDLGDRESSYCVEVSGALALLHARLFGRTRRVRILGRHLARVRF